MVMKTSFYNVNAYGIQILILVDAPPNPPNDHPPSHKPTPSPNISQENSQSVFAHMVLVPSTLVHLPGLHNLHVQVNW